jgi:uncharacterized membrane protein
VSHLRHWALLVAALGAAGRAWFAFSAFVMPALDRLAPAQSIAAMNSINRLAVTPAFMTVLLGSALTCAGLLGMGRRGLGRAPGAQGGRGRRALLLGALLVTNAGNVPLNDALARRPAGAKRGRVVARLR